MSVVFEPGVLNDEIQCINISIIDDNDFEGDDSFAVEISSIYPPIAFGTGDILYILLFKITMVTCTDKLKSSKVWCNYNYDDFSI